MVWPMRLQVPATSKACCHDQIFRREPSHLRGLGAPPACCGPADQRRLLLSAVVVVGAVWQPWSSSARAKTTPPRRGHGQRLPCCVTAASSFEAQEETRVTAILLQLIAARRNSAHLLAQLSERSRRGAVKSNLSKPTPTSGGKGRKDSCRPPPTEGSAPRPRAGSPGSPGLTRLKH